MTHESCPTCGLPTVWSMLRQQRWCSVYGTHVSAAPIGAEMRGLVDDINAVSVGTMSTDRDRLRLIRSAS